MILPFSCIILWNNAALVRDSFQKHDKKILQSQPLQFLSHNTYFTNIITALLYFNDSLLTVKTKSFEFSFSIHFCL